MSSLRGHLLIAAPGLLDPNFARTVVLLGEHGDEGAMGVVLNRRTDASVDEAIPALSELLDATEPVYIGGPVQPQAVVVANPTALHVPLALQAARAGSATRPS